MQDRDRIVRENIQVIGEESFPDDEITWNIKGIKNVGKFCFVESDPLSTMVGYDKFTFILKFTDDQSYTVAACYGWENNQWSLLFTNPSENDDWKDIFNDL